MSLSQEEKSLVTIQDWRDAYFLEKTRAETWRNQNGALRDEVRQLRARIAELEAQLSRAEETV
jgi:predicted  nucleic acid-binding Zn-ribbon protein